MAPSAPSSAFQVAYPLVATIAINTLLLIIISAQHLKEKKERMESELQTLRLENLEAQKKSLQQQLQPHFLFNTLGTLKSLIQEHPTQAIDYTLRLSEFLRYSQKAATTEKVALQEEIEFARDYVNLQQTRFGNALHCEFEIPDAALQSVVPIFAVQSLIENALKHNRMSTSTPIHIRICTEANDLVVVNNRQPKALQMPSGYGLLFDKEICIEASEHQFIVRIPLTWP
jgi:LytS/YehU family sensor histidine kinase